MYYIKEEAGEWTIGTIISDSSVPIIAFSETNDVSKRTGDGLVLMMCQALNKGLADV